MTKKHFIALADTIKANRLSNKAPYNLFCDEEIEVLAGFCASTNPRFNRERWIGYINGVNGKNGGKVK